MLNWLRKGRDAIQDPELPLTEHLTELRDRIMYSAIAICVCACLGFYYAREIIAFLMYPLKQAMSGLPIIPQLHFTSITEPLFQSFKIALFAGIGMAFPFWIYQVWQFVAPGLYQNERKLVTPFILSSSLLFLMGTAFAYTIAVPLAYRFLLLYANPYQAAAASAKHGGLSFELVPLRSRPTKVKAKKAPPGRRLPPPRSKLAQATTKAFPLSLNFKQNARQPGGWKLEINAPMQPQQMTPQGLATLLLKQKQIALQIKRGGTTQRLLIRSRWPTPKRDFLSAALKPILTLQAYLSVSSWFLLGFGLIFQTPLLIILITYSGLISAETLGKYRRHAFVAILFIAAILTPTGDPINLMIMALPMYILFEIGLWVSRIMDARRSAPSDQDDTLDPPSTPGADASGL